MEATELLLILLYVLGSILLVVLIILGIKLINTMNKINVVVDDINKKVKSLDGSKFVDGYEILNIKSL